MRRLASRVLLCAAIVAVALPARGQAPIRLAHIGALSVPPQQESMCLDELRRGLADLGQADGRSYQLSTLSSDASRKSFDTLAAELVNAHVDVIVATVTTAVAAAKRATRTIPIVMATSFQPVEAGLIASLARPGGNLTGIALWTTDLFEKRVQLLKEALPAVTRVAVFRRPRDTALPAIYADAGRRLGVRTQAIDVDRVDSLPAAFEAAKRGGAQAILLTQWPFFILNRDRIAALALKYRLPGLSGDADAARAGMLLSHGPSIVDACRRSAYFVDRILKGAKPADLPAELPSKINFAVNLKTARALGITIPPSVLLRADEVIE